MDEPAPPHLVMLNPEQHRAVTTLQGPLLILAGAGSGKTRVLTRRIAHLLHTGVDPENILAVTFTRKAAEEMKERVAELVGEAGSKVWVSTFHATCCRILRTDIEPLGWTRKFAIYDDDDQLRAIRGVLAALNLDPQRHDPRKLLGRIDYWKNRGYTPDRVLDERRDHSMSTQVRAWEAYEAQLRAADAVDFNDLIGLVVRLWTEHPDVLGKWRDKFRYVLVDEYQDTNNLQYRLLRMLTEQHRNLAVVGDDDQSIYAFRGADISNILNFEEDFPEAEVIRLEQNYRSSGHILHVSNTVVAANTQRIAKKLWTQASNGRRVLFKARDTPEEEARLVAQAARLLHVRDARPYSDMAVVYRTNAMARPFEAALREAHIPYRIVGGRKFHERREVRDALSYLRLVANPADDAAFLRIVNVPSRGIGPSTLRKLREAATAAGQPLLEAARGLGGSSAPLQALRGFVQLMDGLIETAREEPPAALLTTVLRASGYREGLERAVAEEEARPGARFRSGTSETGERLASLDQLVREAERHPFPPEIRLPGEQLRAWLDHIALAGQDEEVPEGGEVTLMTVHNAKGLEYPVVFAVQLMEGQFPHARSLDDRGGVAEERRLAYVAFTRAKELLVVTRARTTARSRGGKVEREPAAPSRFLFGLPVEACEGDLPTVDEGDDAPRAPAPTRGAPAPQPVKAGPPATSAGPIGELGRGERVRHRRFGEGVVRNAKDPSGVIVAFSVGRRVVPANELARLGAPSNT